MYFNYLEKADPDITAAMKREINRQETKIEMIASENFVNYEIMEAMGSALTNKYAEGYPGKRYYGGCEFVDEVEQMAIDRAKKIFGAEHANVQAHSGANANTAVYQAVLEYGDTVLGMDLSNGGHLTHGSPVNLSGKYFHFVPYGVDEQTGRIDYEEVRRLAKEHQPKMIIAGASAYPRIIDFKKFREIADEVGAYLMVDMAHIAGLVAAGLHPSPVPYAHFTTTTTHKTLRGPRGGMILCSAEYAKQIDKAVFPGIQGGPLMHVIAAKAVSFREALSDEFKSYQKQIVLNAAALANGLMKRGINLVSGGTDNHLMLVDLRNLQITGKEAQHNLDEVNITCNKNGIPYDPQSPFITSGIRLGTAAVTARGMDEAAMDEIAELISLTLKDFEQSRAKVTAGVADLVKRFPLYE